MILVLTSAYPSLADDKKFGTLDSRVEMLDRVFNRWVKGIAPTESNPVNWSSNWWVELGTEEDWENALNEWFRRNPGLAARVENGRSNRERYIELIRASLPRYLENYHPDTESPEKVFNSYAAFLRSQRNLEKKNRLPLEADRMAREETERFISRLPTEKRLPFEQWRNDPFIWMHYQKLKTRRELEEVMRDDQKIQRVPFEQWKIQQLQLINQAIAANIKAALQTTADSYWFGTPTIDDVSKKGKAFTRTLLPAELDSIDVQLNGNGYLVTKESSPRNIYLNGNHVSLSNYPNGDFRSHSYHPTKDAPLEFLRSLHALNNTLQEMKTAVTESKYDAPPLILMQKLHGYKVAASNFKSSPLQPISAGNVPGPQQVNEKLTALAWSSKGPDAITHFRPRVNWPLAPTPADVVKSDGYGNLRRTAKATTPWIVTLGVTVGMIAGLHYGMEKMGWMAKTYSFHTNQKHGYGNTFYEETWNNNRVVTPGGKDVDTDRTFGLNGKRGDPTNGPIREEENGSRGVWHVRNNWRAGVWETDLPTRFELSWVNDPSFGNRRVVTLPSESDSAFWLDSTMPQRLLGDGRVTLPVPEGYDLSSIRVYRKDGVELQQGQDFVVEKSDTGHLAVRVDGYWNRRQGSVHMILGYDRTSNGALSQDYYDTHFASLDPGRVNEIAGQMEEAGLSIVARNIKNLTTRNQNISVHDIERAIADSSLYSSYPEGAPKIGKHNPFWFVSRTLNPEGIVCGDCDVVNEVTAVFLEQYFRDKKDVLVERGVLFVRDPKSETLKTPLHGQVYLRSRTEAAKIVLDSTPSEIDPRDKKQVNLIRISRNRPENKLSEREEARTKTHQEERPKIVEKKEAIPETVETEKVETEKKEVKQKEPETKTHQEERPIPETVETEKKEMKQKEPIDPYDHKFRFRGDLPEGSVIGPDPNVKVRRRISDPHTERMLVRLKEGKQTIIAALEASRVRPGANERVPQQAVFELTTLVEDFIEGRISEANLKNGVLKWLPTDKRVSLVDKPVTEIFAALHAEQAKNLANATRQANNGRLSPRYAYLTDPSMQQLILEPLKLASQVSWKPVTWEETEIPHREFKTRLKCGELLELLAQ